MNNQKMNEFLELTKKDIGNLIQILNMQRMNFNLDMKSQVYSALPKTTRDTNLVARLIKGKPKQEREAYFLNEANVFCNAIEEGEFDIAKEIRDDLDYFRHCFLEDSRYHRCPIEYRVLKRK